MDAGAIAEAIRHFAAIIWRNRWRVPPYAGYFLQTGNRTKCSSKDM
jgi:hypothetical protein